MDNTPLRYNSLEQQPAELSWGPVTCRIARGGVSQKAMILAVPLIIFINVAIFSGWYLAESSSTELNLMAENFLISWTALADGRYWTLLTSAFSHNMLWHLFLNMYVLLNFGAIIEIKLGLLRFLRFYFLAAIISSFSHAFASAYFLGQPDLPALGASGAVSAVIVLFSFLYPKQKILLLGIIPLPAMFGAFLFIGLDIWGLVSQAGGGGLPIGHGAHLGGALTGILYFLLFLRRSGR